MSTIDYHAASRRLAEIEERYRALTVDDQTVSIFIDLMTLARDLIPPVGTTETGTVRWYNATKGYGFLTYGKNGSGDAFVHARSLEEAGIQILRTGDKVEFVTAHGRQGISARSLRLLEARP